MRDWLEPPISLMPLSRETARLNRACVHRMFYARSPEWRAVVERADELIASPDFRGLKSEARTRAGIIDVPDTGPVFIKRVEISSWSRGLYARVRGSRAARSLVGAAMLKARGLAHPEPLAAMDMYQAGAVRASYIVSRALINADSLSRFMLGPGEIEGRNVHRRKRISDAVAAQIRRLHESGLSPATCKRPTSWSRRTGPAASKFTSMRPRGFPARREGLVGSRSAEPGASQSRHRRCLCRAARLDFLTLTWAIGPTQ